MGGYLSSPKEDGGKGNRIAILGGAFDPPTANHLMCAAEVIHSGMADEVWLMPCGPRPDKPKLSKALDRYIMTQISVSSHFSAEMPIHVSDFEVLREEAMATYDLLRLLKEKYPGKLFSFVIGTDWLQPGTDIRAWTSKCPETGSEIVTGDKLLDQFDFLVINRPGYDVEDLKSFGRRMTFLTMPEGIHLMEGNLSSTEVRKRTEKSFSEYQSPELIEGLVTPSCLTYVSRSGLYQSSPSKPVRRTNNASGTQKRNVAVFGGAFDPPTWSHVTSLAEIVHSGVADEAVMVPCGPRPDKPHLRSPLVRYTMCQLAVNSSFSHSFPARVSNLEVFEEEALATYDSLCRLRDQDPDANFMFVIGTDWLQPGADLRSWTSKDPVTGKEIVTGDKLLEEFDFIVVKRPGYEVEDLKAFGPRMMWMNMPDGMKSTDSNLSSTEVRRRADLSYRAGEEKLQLLDGLIPPAVFNYIKREQIYKPTDL